MSEGEGFAAEDFRRIREGNRTPVAVTNLFPA